MENMKKISLVNQNIICDRLSEDKSELLNFQIDKKLFLGNKGARMKDDHYLDKEKETQDVPEKAQKRKIIHDEIVLVKRKRRT